MTLASLMSLAQDGTVTQESYAWREGMEAWLKIGEIEVLEKLLSAASAPPVVPVVEPTSVNEAEVPTREDEAVTTLEPAEASHSEPAAEPAPEPEVVTEAASASEPEAASASEPEAATASEPEPEPDSEPEEVTEAAPASEPEATGAPEPEAGAQTEATAEPKAALDAEASPEPPPAPAKGEEAAPATSPAPLVTQTVEVPQVSDAAASTSSDAPGDSVDESPQSDVAAASAAMFAAMTARPADSQAKTVEDPAPSDPDAGHIRFAEEQSKTVEDPMAAMRAAVPAIEEVIEQEALTETSEDLVVELDEVQPIDEPELPELPPEEAESPLTAEPESLPEPPSADEPEPSAVEAESSPESPLAAEPDLSAAETASAPGAQEGESVKQPNDLDDVDAWFEDVPSWPGKESGKEAPQSSPKPPQNKAGVLDSQTQLEAILGQSMKYAGKASKTEKAMLKKALEGAPDMDVMSAIDAPSRAELKTLRKEFSVVEKLEANKRKRVMLVAIAATALIGLGVAAVAMNNAMQESVEKPDYGPTKAAPEVKRALYEVPAEEVMPAAPGGVMNRRQGGEVPPAASEVVAEKSASLQPKTTPASTKKSSSAGASKVSKGSSGARAADTAKRDAERARKVKKMTATDFSQFAAAKGGKAEVKLPQTSKRLAEQKKKKSEQKSGSTISERAKKITGTIGKKRRLLVQCKSDQDEKVKVTFTIAPNGKVTSVRIKGTKNERKKSCIANVFWRSFFPKGETSETFSLPFTI